MKATHPKACVIGNPVSHSLSPFMHEQWLRALGIAGQYMACEFPKDGFASGFASLAKDPDFVGANITLPFKGHALAFGDGQTETARRVGAANLLVRQQDGSWLADNTDVAGFLAPLQEEMPDGKTAIVFGAGGAARAVLVALHQAGYREIVLCNRTDAKAERLCAELNLPGLQFLPFGRRHDPGFAPDLLVQSGAAGMTGFAPLDVDLRDFPKSMLVYDLVYAPLQTSLLAQAEKLEMRSVSGLSMLIAQARPSFQALFDRATPAHPDMLALLAARLGQGA